jgi:hypothetical protein
MRFPQYCNKPFDNNVIFIAIGCMIFFFMQSRLMKLLTFSSHDLFLFYSTKIKWQNIYKHFWVCDFSFHFTVLLISVPTWPLGTLHVYIYIWCLENLFYNPILSFYSQQWVLDPQDLFKNRQADLKVLSEDEYQKIMIFFANCKYMYH